MAFSIQRLEKKAGRSHDRGAKISSFEDIMVSIDLVWQMKPLESSPWRKGGGRVDTGHRDESSRSSGVAHVVERNPLLVG